MKESKNLIWWVVGIVVLLAILWWAFGPYGRVRNSSSNKDGATVSTGNTGLPGGLTAKDYEIRDLEKDLATCKGELEQANNTIALLSECCGKKTVAYTKPPSTNKNIGTGGGSGTSGSNKNVQTPEASYNVNQNAVPKSRVTLDINEQKFCIRLGTQFWPHLAVNNAKEFPELVDNKIGGFDLFILPAGSVGSTGKTYGISEDGTAWIEVAELADWSQYTPDFLDSRGTWITGERVNTNGKEYWVIKY